MDEFKRYVAKQNSFLIYGTTKLYEKGVVEPAELQGCYTCTVKKSIALRLKNVDRVIPITKPK